MKTVVISLLTIAALSSCGQHEDTSADGPRARLLRWHRAFVDGDRRELRRLLTRKSRAYMAKLPKSPAGQSRSIEILSQHRDGARVDFEVRDPSPNAVVKRGVFVMLREDGEWRLDLIETAGANSHEVAQPGPPVRLRQLPLSKAQKSELRKRALAVERQRRWVEAHAHKKAPSAKASGTEKGR